MEKDLMVVTAIKEYINFIILNPFMEGNGVYRKMEIFEHDSTWYPVSLFRS